MNVIEKTISLIAPHRCIICGFEGEPLCEPCQGSALPTIPSRCYRCHGLTRQSSVCRNCRSSVKISHVWASTHYQGAAKELIHKLKFMRAGAAAATIAKIMASTLPDLPPNIIVTHVPTANNRVRVRGYDQAALIAASLSKERNWRHETLLYRTGSTRQVGAGRKERFVHLGKSLGIRRKYSVAGRHVLLIDDVATTGATVEAAAKILKAGGAKTIDAAVFAQA